MDDPFSLMTEKMQMLYMDIVSSLGQLPTEQREFIFGLEGEEDMAWVSAVAGNIALEFIKYSYDYDDPEYSIRHFLENPDDDSERMTQTRIMQYVLKYKKQEIERRNIDIDPNHKFADTNMNAIDKKLKGHRLTEMNFFEHQNIHNLDVIKAIVERRIVSSKKISNKRFQDMFEQYDEFVEVLIERSKKSDEDMVFASIAFFTFEWHFMIETLYFLSCIMEDEGLKTVDQNSLVLICGIVEIESQFGGWAIAESRMVKERLLILPYLFGKDTDEYDRETMRDLIKEILIVVSRYRGLLPIEDGTLYRDWFRKESTVKDWASFFRYYDIFAMWEKKEWTNTRIQNMRYLYELAFGPKN